jgi:hypothetical protein
MHPRLCLNENEGSMGSMLNVESIVIESKILLKSITTESKIYHNFLLYNIK